jgi:tetratricopeptide (TPR) repeat protein
VLQSVVADELSNSSALDVVNDDRLPTLLQAIGQARDARLTTDLARQVCDRGKGKAVAQGTIERRGNGYSIQLVLQECSSGRALSDDRADSPSLNDVLLTTAKLAALARSHFSGMSGNVASDPASLPTSSVEALKVFNAGAKLHQNGQDKQASAMFERATQLDAAFGEAWVWKEVARMNLADSQGAIEALKRAFALRDKMPGELKSSVEADYYLRVTGEIYKSIDSYHQLEALAPDGFAAHNVLGMVYAQLGLYQKSEEELRKALAIGHEAFMPYLNLANTLQAQGKYDEVEAVLKRARERKFSDPFLHRLYYSLALVRSDAAALERENVWMAENADDPLVVSMQADLALFAGHLTKARQAIQREVAIERESNLGETAARHLLDLARAEVLLGEPDRARDTVAQAMKLANAKDVNAQAALVLALSGQVTQGLQIMDRLVRENPTSTILSAIDAPVLRSAAQLNSGQPEQAVYSLEAVKPYEFGLEAGLLPNYLRATAYLKLGRSQEAAAEFKAVLDHRGVDPIGIVYVMAHLSLARAYVLQGDTAKARAAYDDFLSLWKDADLDIPVLIAAKAEYAKLK